MDLKPLPVHVVVRDPVSLHGLEGTGALYRGLKTREKEYKGRKKGLAEDTIQAGCGGEKYGNRFCAETKAC